MKNLLNIGNNYNILINIIMYILYIVIIVLWQQCIVMIKEKIKRIVLIAVIIMMIMTVRNFILVIENDNNKITADTSSLQQLIRYRAQQRCCDCLAFWK